MRSAIRLLAAARTLARGGAPRAARALRRAALGRFSSAERARLHIVEELREGLLASSEPVELDLAEYFPIAGEETVIRGTVADAARAAAIDRSRGRALFALARDLGGGRIVELGTSVGVSTAYLAAAAELVPGGRVITIEMAEPVARLAERHHRDARLATAEFWIGRFRDLIDPAIAALGAVDLAFVDGDHNERPTLDYFDRIAAAAAPGAAVAFDNVEWSEGMRRAWERIRQDGRVAASATAGALGVAVVRGGAGSGAEER